jgi:hypothetical protein
MAKRATFVPERARHPLTVTGLAASLGCLPSSTARKNTDAAKVVDCQTTLNALATAPKPKVDPAVAQALSAEAQGVVVCINEIGTAEVP